MNSTRPLPAPAVSFRKFAASAGLLSAFASLAWADASADLRTAGISTRAIDFLEAHPRWTTSLKTEPTLATVLTGLLAPDPAVPASATVITSAAGLASIQPGGTYFVDGHLALLAPINLRSNTTLYLRGSLTLLNQPLNNNWATRAILDISGTNIRVIGLENAKLVSDHTASGVWVYDASKVLVQGLDIGFTEQAFTARWNVSSAVFRNNYCHDLRHRAFHTVAGGGAGHVVMKHNFVDRASDGFDFDYASTNSIAFENVIVGASRWIGYMEEGAQSGRAVANLGVMAKWFGESHMMGICDNGTTSSTFGHTGRLTKNNYFVKNVVYGPTVAYTGRADYWAKPDTGDIAQNAYGPIYMWGNTGYNYAGQTGYIEYTGAPLLLPGVAKIADPNAPEVVAYLAQTQTTIEAVEKTVGAPRDLAPEADAHVWDGAPANNYGTATSMQVKDVSTSGGYDRVACVRFPLSSLIAPARVATLKLKVVGLGAEGAGNRTVEVRQLAADAWGETTLNWNNRPATNGALIATITDAGTIGQTYSIDVTSYVNAQYAGDKVVSFALVQPSGVGKLVHFGTRENAGHAPVLEIQ